MTSTEGAIEDADARHEHAFTIIVDGQPKVVPTDIVTYVEVVELAYPGQSSDPQYNFTMTYRHAADVKHHGTLIAGQEVRVKHHQTAFNVTRTSKS